MDAADLTAAATAPPHHLPETHLPMDLDQLTDQPTTVPIGGKPYRFSELPIEHLGRLQKWIREHVPNPLVAVRPHLAGFDAEQQAVLLDQARRDALAWPPKVGTAAGAGALLGSEDGQVATLRVALSVHQPDATEADARRLYKALKREAAAEARRARAEGRAPDPAESSKATRIYAIAFGMDELLGDDDDPKGPAAAATPTDPSPGT